MIDLIKLEAEAAGDKAEIISAKELIEIRQDIENIKSTGWLNDFQKFIVDDLYELEFPSLDFEIKSIILVAAPGYMVRLIFNKDGKKVSTLLPPTYMDYNGAPKRVEGYLNKLMNPQGYHICIAPKLPHKLLAVRSGLSKYGRNNISYIDGMGSFYKLVMFYSDLPCEKDELFPIMQMDSCRNCNLCMKNCPTNAILEDRYLIDNKRCLTYFNEAGGWDFPDWIDKSAHNSIYGCVRCQIVCPHNRKRLNSDLETVEFTEQETDMLLEGGPLDGYTEGLKKKVKALEMEGFLSAVPRNLKVLIERK